MKKAKVTLESIRGAKTVNEIAQEFGHPTQVGLWNKELQTQAASIFDAKRGPKPVDPSASSERLHSEIGQLKMDLDWLKKVRDRPVEERGPWVDSRDPLAITRQRTLASLTRSTVYTSHVIAERNEQESVLLVEIDAGYIRHPFYDSRKMVVHPRVLGHSVNRERVQRLMRLLGLAGMAPGPNTSAPHPQHKLYPYLCSKA